MDRSSQIIRTSLVGIAANVLLASFKALVGIMAGSISVVMDAVNNLSDVLSSAITIIGTKLSMLPADRHHPFGYGRVEYFSAIVIAVMVLCAGFASLLESGKKVVEPTSPSYSTATLVVIVASIAVKLVLGWYVKQQGQRLGSDALVASGADALFDAVVTLATLISAVVMLLWKVSLDGYLGVLISLLIIKAGVEMLASPVNELIGNRIPQELLRTIKTEVAAFEDVHGVFDIILHNYGPNLKIGSLHISVPDTMNAAQIHRLTRRITETMLERHNIVLTIGVYAVATGDKNMAALQRMVMQTLAPHKEIIQAHGFCYYEAEQRISVDVVPDITVKDDEQLAETLAKEIRAQMPPHVQVTIIIDHNYAA